MKTTVRMVERVAKALYEQWAAFFEVSKTWESAEEHAQKEFRVIARTAIAAMREPTDGMRSAVLGNAAVPVGLLERKEKLVVTKPITFVDADLPRLLIMLGESVGGFTTPDEIAYSDALCQQASKRIKALEAEVKRLGSST